MKRHDLKTDPEAFDAMKDGKKTFELRINDRHFEEFDLQGAFEEKMLYNSTRQDHTHEARRIAGGKQF